MEKGVQRWIVDISKWNPSPSDFSFALSVLPLREHSSVTRFVKMEDRKRALVSRLLQYALVHDVLGIPYDKIVIKRTLEGKPYLESDDIGLEFPNFNFNATHHGDYVAIASEPLCLVGYWCLKESYVKAVGSGLASQTDKVEFHHTNWTNISVHINGVAMTEWKLWLLELNKRHWVSIARGPPSSAIDSYKRTLKNARFSEDEYRVALHLPNASFVFRTVEQLFPVLHR